MWARGRNNYWRNRKSRKRPRKKQVLCRSINLDVFTSSAFSVQSFCVYIYIFPMGSYNMKYRYLQPYKNHLCKWDRCVSLKVGYTTKSWQLSWAKCGSSTGKSYDGWPTVTSCHIPKLTSLCLAGPLFFATWGWIPINIEFIITQGFWKYMNSSFVSSLY